MKASCHEQQHGPWPHTLAPTGASTRLAASPSSDVDISLRRCMLLTHHSPKRSLEEKSLTPHTAGIERFFRGKERWQKR